jgi:hypothetical protein
VPRYRCIGFESSPFLSFAAALRGRSTGTSGVSTSLHPGTGAQGGCPVGPGPHVRDWSAAFGGDGEARWFGPRVAVRLLRTWRPTPKEHDSWARTPVLEAWLLVLLEVKRRTTAGGGLNLTRRFAFFALGDRRPRSMTRGPEPPCQRLGHLGARWARSSVALQGVSGGYFL